MARPRAAGVTAPGAARSSRGPAATARVHGPARAMAPEAAARRPDTPRMMTAGRCSAAVPARRAARPGPMARTTRGPKARDAGPAPEMAAAARGAAAAVLVVLAVPAADAGVLRNGSCPAPGGAAGPGRRHWGSP